MVAFTDSFTRADENLEANANWTRVDGTAGWGAVRSNALACLTTDTTGAAFQCPDTGVLNHYVQAKLLTVTASSGPFLCCRLADRNNFVGFRYDQASNRIELYRRNAGVLTSLAPVAITCVVGDVMKLQMDGATGWSLYKNGALVDSGSSSGIATLNSTRCGVVMRSVSTNPWVDDFEATGYTAPSGAVDFPASPTVGQIFAPGGGLPQYVWTGTVWNSYGTSQPKTWMSLAASPPASPVDGDFWWQTDTGLLYVRYNDGSSVQWVVATPAMDLAALDTRYKQISDGGVFKIASGTLAAVSLIDIPLPAGYTAFELHLLDWTHTVNTGLGLRMSMDGTTFMAGASDYFTSANANSNTANTPFGGVGAHALLAGTIDSNTNIRAAMKINIPIAGAGVCPVIHWTGFYMGAGTYFSVTGMAFNGQALGPPKAVRLFSVAPNIAAGSRWFLNGIK